MSSPEPERPEYERPEYEWSRRRFFESDPCLHNPSGGRIEFEDVRLEGTGTGESSVVITFRASGRPGPGKTTATYPSSGR